jgi:uncharacterized membrane protein YdbT with pleckstrin-like domain
MVVGEEILVDIKPHWMYLVGPLVTSVVVIGVAVGFEIAFPHTPVGWHRVEAITAFVPCAWLVIRFIRWRMAGLVVTSFRIVERHGVFRSSTSEIWLSSIEAVDTVQSVFRRMVGTGELEVTIYGEDDLQVFGDVRKPAILQRIIARRLTPPPGYDGAHFG